LTTNQLVEPPNIVCTYRSSHVGGSPLADADTIADMASGDLIRNLHLNDDDNDIQGCRLYMDDGRDVVGVHATVAPDVMAVHTTTRWETLLSIL
jgi:hypothetical protein